MSPASWDAANPTPLVARRAGRSLLAIALGGVWGWRGRMEKPRAQTAPASMRRGRLSDLDLWTWMVATS